MKENQIKKQVSVGRELVRIGKALCEIEQPSETLMAAAEHIAEQSNELRATAAALQACEGK